MALSTERNSWQPVPEDSRFHSKRVGLQIYLHYLNEQGLVVVESFTTDQDVYTRINQLIEARGGLLLGRTIARITHALGIKTCGACAARQARLNRLGAK